MLPFPQVGVDFNTAGTFITTTFQTIPRNTLERIYP